MSNTMSTNSRLSFSSKRWATSIYPRSLLSVDVPSPEISFPCVCLCIFGSVANLTPFQDDLTAFHAKHFPRDPSVFPTTNLREDGLLLEEQEQENVSEYDGDDDGLGYYPDGVKRTLTDEQIQIFRHSEIHALLRERELQLETEDHSSVSGEITNEGNNDGVDHSFQGMKSQSSVLEPRTCDHNSTSNRYVEKRKAGIQVEERPPAQNKKRRRKRNTGDRVYLGHANVSYADSVPSEPGGRRPDHGDGNPHVMGRRLITYDD